MTKVKQRQLMRRLHGELPPDQARQLERELEKDGELRMARDQLARTWDGLELPVSGVPNGFSASVMTAAGKLQGNELSWSLAPAWARSGAAAALVTGLLLGATFGMGLGAPEGDLGTALVADAEADSAPLSLAEIYWLSLEEGSDLLVEEAAAEVVR